MLARNCFILPFFLKKDEFQQPALSVHDSYQRFIYVTVSLSSYKQMCLMRLHFERYFSHHGTDVVEVSLETYPQNPKNIFVHNVKLIIL